MKGRIETVEKMIKWLDREADYCDACADEIDLELAPTADVTQEEWRARWGALDRARDALKEFLSLENGDTVVDTDTIKDTHTSLAKFPKKLASFEKKAKALAAELDADFDYAYGDNPCLDLQPKYVEPLDLDQWRDITAYERKGAGFVVNVVTDNVDDDKDYIQVVAVILDIDKISKTELTDSMEMARMHCHSICKFV